MTITKGFGITLTFGAGQGGSARNWYLDKQGVQRWVDNDQPCETQQDGQPAENSMQHMGRALRPAPGKVEIVEIDAKGADDLAKRLNGKPKCAVDGVLYGGLALCRHKSVGSDNITCHAGRPCEHKLEGK